MYSIERILVEDKLTTTILDSSTYKLRDVFERWDNVTVILSAIEMVDTFKLILTDHPELRNYTATISEFISTLDLTAYPLSVYLPADERKYAVSKDVWEENWTADGVNAMYDISSMDDNTIIKHDILLRRSDKAYTETAKTCMFSVNGLYHPVSASTDGVFVLGGKLNTDCKKDSQLAMVDFSALGNIQYVSITRDNVFKINPVGTLFNDGVYIRIPEELLNHTLMVCLCGHLYMLSEIVTFVDKDILRIDIRNVDLEAMVLEHYDAIGINGLVDVVTGAMSPKRMRTDAGIMDILDSICTFIVAIDNPKVYKEVIQLTYEGIPGVYSNPDPVFGIAHYSNYKVADYLQDYQDGLYCIRTTLDRYENYRHLTTDWERQNVVTKAKRSIDKTEVPFLYMTNLYVKT